MGAVVKVAILSDIHGNAIALKEVLHSAARQHADHLVVLGDMVGYYYDAESVLRQLREWPFTIIRGNHETFLAAAYSGTTAAAAYRAIYGSSLDIVHKTLPRKDIDWLLALPESMDKNLDGVDFDMFHGSPFDSDEYVYPNTHPERLRQFFRPGRVVLLGHTHYPMIATQSEGVLINPGSVGQARDGGGFASWCLFDTSRGIAQFQRTPYDVSPILQQIKQYDPHLSYLTSVLTRGNPLLTAPSIADAP